MEIFDDRQWSYENSKKIGLPRPHANPPIEDQFTQNGERHLAPRVPMPWQTEPDYRFDKKIGKFVLLIAEREKEIYVQDICGYCAVKFQPDDEAVIWTNYDKIISVNGARVYSDYHPFHLDCMEQTRIFCPHMRKTNDSEYKYGKYFELKIEILKYLESKGYTDYRNPTAYDDFIPIEYRDLQQRIE
jgi:hypothetical protein